MYVSTITLNEYTYHVYIHTIYSTNIVHTSQLYIYVVCIWIWWIYM